MSFVIIILKAIAAANLLFAMVTIHSASKHEKTNEVSMATMKMTKACYLIGITILIAVLLGDNL